MSIYKANLSVLSQDYEHKIKLMITFSHETQSAHETTTHKQCFNCISETLHFQLLQLHLRHDKANKQENVWIFLAFMFDIYNQF